jgi:hypothetical protein
MAQPKDVRDLTKQEKVVRELRETVRLQRIYVAEQQDVLTVAVEQLLVAETALRAVHERRLGRTDA